MSGTLLVLQALVQRALFPKPINQFSSSCPVQTLLPLVNLAVFFGFFLTCIFRNCVIRSTPDIQGADTAGI